MAWSIVNFGRYKGKTLPQIVMIDPDYFFWACEEGVFKDKGILKSESGRLLRKASSIKIPQSDVEPMVAEYFFHPSNGKLTDVVIVPASRGPHVGSSRTLRKEVLDLSVARGIADYDKMGGNIITQRIKELLLGNPTRLTKQRCEAFFDDDRNFLRN